MYLNYDGNSEIYTIHQFFHYNFDILFPLALKLFLTIVSLKSIYQELNGNVDIEM